MNFELNEHFYSSLEVIVCSQWGVYHPQSYIYKQVGSKSVSAGSNLTSVVSLVNACISSVIKHRAPREGSSVNVCLHFQSVRGRGFKSCIMWLSRYYRNCHLPPSPSKKFQYCENSELLVRILWHSCHSFPGILKGVQ